MREIEIGKVYRHFKGNYYFVENVGKYSKNCEDCVIYKRLYDSDKNYIWIRPLKMFLEEIDSNRPDNITGQKHRFELANDITKNYLNN